MENNPNLRLILAVALSFLFIFLYSHYFVQPREDAKTQDPKTLSSSSLVDAPPSLASADSSNPAPRLSISDADADKVSLKINAKNFEVDMDSLARISQVYLKEDKYTNSADELGFFDHIKILLGFMKKPAPIDKLPLFKGSSPRPLELLFEDSKINQESFNTPYKFSESNIVLGDEPRTITLIQELSTLTVKKILTFYPDLHYDIKIEVSDPNTRYFLSNGSRPIADRGNYAFNGVVIQKENEKIEKIEDGDAKPNQDFGNVKFIASVDRYFTTLFYAKNDLEPISIVVDADSKKNPKPYLYHKGDLELGGYIGPKDHRLLDSISPNLTRVIEYGLITFFARPMFLLLDFLYQGIGNWGWAIILLTVIVKLILYPLTYKGMVGMQKLKDLAPKIKELQAKYKQDPQKLQLQMMQLYKEHGANPLGGCLPLIIQIPIFYAIYRVLYNSVELKSAGFIFWIHDLSVMDPFFVLPILMGISMYVQQRITPSAFSDPMQARIFRMLPVVFTLFLIFFPAGLVLYWTTNSILSIIQQAFINFLLDRKNQQQIYKKNERKNI